MITWKNSDAVQLAAYLEKSGGRFLQYLNERRPRLGGDTMEAAAMNAKTAEGAEAIIELIPEMAAFTETAKQPLPFVSIRDHAPASKRSTPAV